MKFLFINVMVCFLSISYAFVEDSYKGKQEKVAKILRNKLASFSIKAEDVEVYSKDVHRVRRGPSIPYLLPEKAKTKWTYMVNAQHKVTGEFCKLNVIEEETKKWLTTYPFYSTTSYCKFAPHLSFKSKSKFIVRDESHCSEKFTVLKFRHKGRYSVPYSQQQCCQGH